MDTLVAAATMKSSSSTDNQSSILLGLKHPSNPLLISTLPNFNHHSNTNNCLLELQPNNNNNYYKSINNNNSNNNNNNNNTNCSGNRMQLQLHSNKVLKKVASFSANTNTNNSSCSTSSPSDKHKTHYIPEKLSFGDYEKFEGKLVTVSFDILVVLSFVDCPNRQLFKLLFGFEFEFRLYSFSHGMGSEIK